MIVGINREIIRANRAVAEYAGIVNFDLLGKTCFEIFHLPPDVESCPEDVCIKTRKTQHTELTDPETGRVFLMSVSPFLDEENEVLGTVDVARDITKIRSIEAALTQSEAQFRGLAESVEDIIFSIDSMGRFVYLNPAVKDVLGFEPQDLSGKEVTKSPLEDFIVWDAINKDMFPGKEQIPLFETEVKDSNGRKRILEVSARRLPGQTVGVARDVTERKIMEHQLIRASKLASIGVLAAGIAHQVNNPLAIMVLSATAIRDLLSQDEINAEEFRKKTSKYIDTLNRQIERTRKVVSGLLSFTQEKQAKIVPTDIKDILADSTQFISQHPSRNTLSLNVSHSTELPKVLVDAVALGQVIVNIIQNAIDAMKGEGEITIRTEKSSAEYVRIHIGDSGPGIPRELREEIFEPLFSTKTADRGTGLGLPLSVMLLERFGGRIYLEDKPPPGATFIIEVPLAKEEQDGS